MTPTATRSLLSTFWDRHAFSIGDFDFLWIDVALGAMSHGVWATFERRLAEGLACAARADVESGRSDEGAIDEAATAFRYERDLISGADLSAWLERAGVSIDDWMAWVRRDVLRRTWAAEVDETLDRFPPSPRQLEAAAVAEGICSGLFETFEQSFAGRVAVAVEEDAEVLQAGRVTAPALGASAARLARRHAHWLGMRAEADTHSRLTFVLQLDERFQTVSERLTTPESLRDIVEAYRLEWVSFEVDTIAFAREAAAREAVLCVKEDGLSLQDVGALSRQTVRRTHAFLEDVPREHRDRLLSAEPGQLLGPLPVDGVFEVTMVITRRAPTLDDARVVERARRTAVDGEVRRAARDHVRRRRQV